MKRSLLVLVLAACGAKQAAVISIPGVDAGPAPPTNVPPTVVAERPCTIDIAKPETFPIPPRLQAIAPQYFHAGGHEGFNDLVPSSKRYRWYDPNDLQTPIDPPGDMEIIERATKNFYFGRNGSELRAARRNGHEAKKFGHPGGFRIVDVTEDRLGNAWVLAASAGSSAYGDLWLMRINPDLTWDENPSALTLGVNIFDAALAVTDDRTVGIVILDRDANELRLSGWWIAPKRDWTGPNKLDSVTLPPMAVELSIRTTVDLAVAWHGSDTLAIAWRPLAPKEGEIVDAGSKAKPPTKPVSAAVRIFLARAWENAVAPPMIHPTVAAPLGGVSGIGPWPLHSNGMRGATLHQQAVFAWIDDGVVKIASPGDATARTVDNGFPRLVFRSVGADLDLLMLQSGGPQKMVRLGCAP